MIRVLEPAPDLLAFYEGRDGARFLPGPNWVDDGALSLGIATYALLAGDHALVYDTHVAPDRGRFIRAHLESRGIRRFTVVLSHWHLDHVAGSEAFAGCEIIANTRTAAHLAAHRAAIEDASFHGPPAIAPLILPGRVFDGRLTLDLGGQRAELLTFDIHSDDATVIWLPDRGLLLAGDTVEDCVTWVGEPGRLGHHQPELARLAALGARRILPCHGDPGRIASGGYGPGLIAATQDYVQALAAGAAGRPLAEVIAGPLARGDLVWFPPYEEVHAANLARLRALA